MIDIKKVKRIISQETGISVDKIDQKDNFYEDLNFDSRSFAKLILKIENELDILFDKKEVATVVTVEHLALLVKYALERKIPVDNCDPLEDEIF